MNSLTKDHCLVIGLVLTILSFFGIIMAGFNLVSLGLATASLIPFRWAYIKHMTW